MTGARLSEANAGFNRNGGVEGTAERWRLGESGSRQFAALLRALDVPKVQADGLVDSLVDWIDSDQPPGPAGAEDASYLVRDPAYRTGGALLAVVTELRAIPVSADPIYRTPRPPICATPPAALSPSNPNATHEPDAERRALLTPHTTKQR